MWLEVLEFDVDTQGEKSTKQLRKEIWVSGYGMMQRCRNGWHTTGKKFKVKTF